MAIIGSAHVEIHGLTDKIGPEIRDGVQKGMKGQGTDAGKQFTDEFGNETSRGMSGVTTTLGGRISKAMGGSGTAAGKSFSSKFQAVVSSLSNTKIAGPNLDTKVIEARIEVLRSKLEKLRDIQANPTVELDTALVEARIAQVTARLNDLRKMQVTPKIAADTAYAEAQLAKLQAQLAAMKRNPGTAKVDADIGVAEIAIAKLEAKLSEISRNEHNVKVRVSDKDLTQSLIKIAALSRAIATLMIPVAAVGATPAIASLGAAAVEAAGALYLLPAAAGVAALGVGTLVTAFAHLGDALGPTGTPAQIKKVNEALASLSPQARATVTEIRGLSDEWTTLRVAVQDRMFQGVSDDVAPLAGIYLPMLNDSMTRVAGGFNTATQSIFGFLQTTAGIETVRGGMAGVTTATTTLTGVLPPLSRAFFDIFFVGSQYMTGFANGLVNVTNHFANYIAQARASGELNAIIERGIAVLQDLAELAMNLGGILGSVFDAGQASGLNFLGTLVGMTGRLNAFFNSAEGSEILVGVFRTINDTVTAMLPGLRALGTAMTESFGNLGPVLPQVAQAFSDLAVAGAPLMGMLTQLASVVLPPLLSLISAMSPVLGPAIVGFGLLALGAAAVVSALNFAKAASASYQIMTAILTGTTTQATIAQNANTLAVAAGRVAALVAVGATKAWAAAQWLLNAAFIANPIGFIVLGIAALVAAIILAYKNSETFRNIVQTAFDAVATAVGVVIDWFKKLPSIIGGVFDWVKGVFQGIADFLAQWGPLILAFIAPFIGIPLLIVQNWDTITAFFGDLWNTITDLFSAAVDGVVNFFTQLPNRIAYALGFLVGSVVKFFTETGPAALDAVVNGFWSVIDWFRALPGQIGSYLLGLAATFAANAIAAWDGFTEGLGNAFDATVAWFQALPGNIATYLLGLAVTFAANARSAWDGFTAGLASAFDATVAWFQALPGNISSYLLGLAATFTANAISAWNGFTAGLETAWDATIAWFQALPGNIGTFFANAGTWLLSVGGDIIDGLIGGLTSAGAAVLAWFLGLADSFMQGFKDALGIASPSTMFAQFGTWILEGLVNGLVAMGTTVMGWVTSFVDLFIAGWNALLGFFSTVWTGIQNVATTVWSAIVAYFSAAFAAWQALFSAVWTGIQAVFSAVWTGIQAVATTVWNAIAAFFSGAFAAYQAAFAAIWNAIQAVFSAVWTGIQTVATTVWNAISAFFTNAFNAYKAAFQLIWTTIQTIFQTVWTFIQNIATTVWNAIQAFFTGAFNAFQAAFNAVWNAISAFFSAIWEGIKAAATAIWNAISAFFTNAFAAYQAAFSLIWETIKTIFTNVWEGIKTAATTVWNAIASFFTGAWDTFKRLWDSFWDGIKTSFTNLWEGIKNVAKGAWEGIQTMFREGINTVIRVVNWPIEKINGALNISIPTIPELATGGTTDREGVQKAGRVSGIGSTTSDAHLTRLSREEHVWSAAEVRAAGGHDAVRRMRAQVMSGYSPDTTTGSVAGAMAASRVSPDSLGGRSAAAGLRRRQLMDRFPKLDGAGRAMLAYGGVRPHVAAAGDEVTRALGAMPGGIGGVGARGNVSDHPAGLALDFMSMGNVGLGDRVAQYLQGNAQRLAVKYLIWQQAINEGSGWTGMEDRGSATANHMDHVHASFLADAGAGQAFGGGGLFDPGKLFDDAAAMLGLPETSRQMTRDIMPDIPQWLEPMGISFHDKAWSGMRAAAIKLLESISTLGGLIGGGPGATGPVVDQVRAVANGYGWGSGPEWDAIYNIVQKESSWNPAAANPTSAARGLFQKMTSLHGPVEPTAGGQAQWGLNYIKGKYGTPTAAWAHHQRVGSYDTGGWLKPGITQAINGTGKPEAIIADPMTTFERSFKKVFNALAPNLREALENGSRYEPEWARHLKDWFSGRHRGGNGPVTTPPPVVIPPLPPIEIPTVEVPPVVVPKLPVEPIRASFDEVLNRMAPELSSAIEAGSADQIASFSREILGNNERLAAMSAEMGVDIAPILRDLVASVTANPIIPPSAGGGAQAGGLWARIQSILGRITSGQTLGAGYSDKFKVSDQETIETAAKAAGQTVQQYLAANPNIATGTDPMRDFERAVGAKLGAIPNLMHRLDGVFPDIIKAVNSADTGDLREVLGSRADELLTWLQTQSTNDANAILNALGAEPIKPSDIAAAVTATVGTPNSTTTAGVSIADGAFQVTINGNADSVTVDQLRDTLTAWSDEIIHQYEGRT